jgi:molecular chaperone GrpE
MDEDDARRPEGGAGPAGPAAGEEEGYQLDVDAETDLDVEAAAREALAAVEARGAAKTSGAGRADAADTQAGDEEVANLQAELADLRDRSIRTLADFENYRRRSERERDDLRRFAVADSLREMLPVVDNLERALAAGGTVEDLKLGVELTLRQFKDLLRQRGIEEVRAVGEPFDPALHEAVAREETPDVAVPTVTSELQRGYTIHGRLLRPALVKVAMPVEAEGAQSSQ